jgi:hypothetical protein
MMNLLENILNWDIESRCFEFLQGNKNFSDIQSTYLLYIGLDCWHQLAMNIHLDSLHTPDLMLSILCRLMKVDTPGVHSW